MQQILAIAYNHVYIFMRTPITLIMAFVMPILFTAVLGAAFSGFSEEGDTRTEILVVNEDEGRIADEVLATINNSSVIKTYQSEIDEATPTTVEAALNALEDYERILILPPDFSEALLAGNTIKTFFHVAENNQTNQAAEQEISFALNQVSTMVQTARTVTEEAGRTKPFASTAEEAAYFEQTMLEVKTRMANLPVSVRSEKPTVPGLQIPEGTQQSSPGNLVMFGLITLLSSAIVLVEERNEGTLRRLVISPLSKTAILAGKTLGPLLVGLIQMAVLILVGQFLFGVPWGRSPLALLMMVLTFDLAIVSLGIFLSTLVKTTDQVVAIMIASSMAMAALGGAWWPIEIVPPFMKTLGHFFPSAWAMGGFVDIILRGAGVMDVLLPSTVLLGFAVLFFGLGIWRFRYE
ncbi:MAG: ABC transporter permease [Chloroflexota bacterium]